VKEDEWKKYHTFFEAMKQAMIMQSPIIFMHEKGKSILNRLWIQLPSLPLTSIICSMRAEFCRIAMVFFTVISIFRLFILAYKTMGFTYPFISS
jgi:hypothetical protein